MKLIIGFALLACAYAQFQQPSTSLLGPFGSTPRPFGLQPQYRRPTYRPVVPVTPRPTLPPTTALPVYKSQPIYQNQPIYRSAEANARILKQSQDISSDGNSFQYSYETENGISAGASGTLRQISKDEDALDVVGAFQYISPEGIAIVEQYEANENGYQPKGEHIPTPPPIPEPILRALEWIRTHPEPIQQQRRY